MTISPETLQAFIDGALPEEEAHRIAAEIATDAETMAYVEDQRALKAALTSPFLKRLHRFGEQTREMRSLVPVTTMAAGIALGLVLAASWGAGADIVQGKGALMAEGGLAAMLSGTLSSDDQDAEPDDARVGESFRSRDRSFCRTFLTAAAAGRRLSGVACRETPGWRIVALVSTTDEQSQPLDMPPAIKAAVADLILGEPLDDEREREARLDDWRAQ